MLLGVLLSSLLFSKVNSGSLVGQKPCSLSLPLDFPNRNDRSEQCWLRVEDVDLTETVSIWCYVAHSFLRNYINDYNTQKMTEDNVDLNLWNDDPRAQDDIIVKLPKNNQKGLKDWRLATVLDPITHMRWYVTKNADCRIIMYSRDGTSNYRIGCEKILFHINEHQAGNSAKSRVNNNLISACIFFIFTSIKISF